MTRQVSYLAIAIDSQEAIRNAKAVQKELKSIETTGDFAAKSVEGTSKSINQFSQEGAKGASSAKVLAGQIGSVGTHSKIASDGLSKVTQSTNTSAASMNLASTAAQALASRIMAIATVGAAVSKMDAFAGFENRLKLVTSSQTELNQAMNDTFRIAQSSRQEWDSVVQVYQRFSENAKTLGIDMKKTAELTETVSKAVAISGASSASAEAALTQFGQALASGVLRGEELNSVMEQTPGLSKAIAQGMGVTVGQLRAVAAEGKITTDVLVEALTKSKDSVNELFGKTSMTIGQSMTALNNEITKFVGEAGKTSGAAQAIAQSIQLISENLSAISSVAMLGGVAYLTKAILTKGNALRKNASDALAARSAVQVLAVQEQQLAVAVLNDAKAHLASIQATGAATQAKYGATAAALRYKQALDQVSIAQAKVDSLGSGLAKFGNIASKGLALVGGPIGALTIGVTAASAAYGYFSGKAEEATQKLAEQAKTADKTDEALKKLTGTERQKAIDDLNDTFKDQEKQLRKSELAMGSALVAIESYYGVLSKEGKIAQDARNGVISYNEALEELNKLKIKKDMYDRLVAEIPKYDEASGKIQNTAGKLKIYGIESEISGNKAQNAAALHNLQRDAIEGVGNAAIEASKKLKEFNLSNKDRSLKASYELDYLNQGYTPAQASALVEAQEKLGLDSAILSEQQKKNALDRVAIEEKRDGVLKNIADKERESNKQTEKQLKTLQASAKVRENAIKYDFAYFEKLNGLPAGMLTALHAIESGNSGKTNQVNKTTGATGGFQFTKDAATDYKLKDRFDMRDSARAAGEYMRDNLKKFDGNVEKAIRAYHAGPTNVKNGTGMGKYNNDYWDKYQRYQGGLQGYSGSKSDFTKQINNQGKLLEDEAKLRKSLELEIATEVDRILGKHKAKLDEVTKANFSEEKTREVVARLTEITQNEIDITEFSLRKKYDDYSDYLKSEEELLVKSYQERAFYADHDLTLTKDERKNAVALLQDQMDKELLVIRQTQQEKQSLYDQELAKRRREIDDKMARNTMGRDDYQRYTLAQDQRDEYKANEKWFTDEQASIDKLYRAREISQEEHFKRMEQAKIDHVDKDLATSLEYQKKEADVLESQKAAQLQLWSSLVSQGQTTWSQMTQSVKDGAGEQSASYKTMFAMQQAFSIASTLIATHLAAMQVTADGANPTLFGKVTAHSAILAMGYAQAGLIASQAIAGFATGGQIKGAGTSTSDSIPIMASDGEFMTRTWAVQKIGVDNYEYMNRTGELPYHKFQEQLLLEQGTPKIPVQKFSTGGLVGSPQQSSPMVERQRLIAMRESNARSGDVKITIVNNTPQPVEATHGWNGDELQVILTEMKKQNRAETQAMIDKSWIDASRQNGPLDQIKRGRY